MKPEKSSKTPKEPPENPRIPLRTQPRIPHRLPPYTPPRIQPRAPHAPRDFAAFLRRSGIPDPLIRNLLKSMHQNMGTPSAASPRAPGPSPGPFVPQPSPLTPGSPPGSPPPLPFPRVGTPVRRKIFVRVKAPSNAFPSPSTTFPPLPPPPGPMPGQDSPPSTNRNAVGSVPSNLPANPGSWLKPDHEVMEDTECTRIVVELPGISSEENISLRVRGRDLCIRAQGEERSYYTEITLDGDVDREDMVTTFKNGVMELRLTTEEGT